MRYAVLFAVLGGILAAVATLTAPIGLILAWPAASCLLVAAAYLFGRPGLLGKRPDGTQRLSARILLAPYLAIQHATSTRTRPAAHEIAPGVWLGRRPRASEIHADVKTVVDLTAEFDEAVDVRTGRRYICLATLDATAPRAEDLARLASEIAKSPDPVLIHCAAGHGRSALIAACVLVAREIARDPEHATELLVAARSRVRLNAAQNAALTAFCKSLERDRP